MSISYNNKPLRYTGQQSSFSSFYYSGSRELGLDSSKKKFTNHIK